MSESERVPASPKLGSRVPLGLYLAISIVGVFVKLPSVMTPS